MLNDTIRFSRSVGRFFLCVAALGLSSRVEAEILNVPGEYPTIQAAVNAAVTGDEVLIAPGTYVQPGVLTINKAITVRGSGGAQATMITGGSILAGIIDLTGGPATVLDGVTVSNGNNIINQDGVVDVFGSGPTIMNCIFRDNIATAIKYSGAGAMLVSNCQFIDNSDDTSGAALLISQSTTTIVGCTFTGNSALQGGAIAIGGGTIMDCAFENNISTVTSSPAGGGAIRVVPSAPVLIDNCTFNGNSAQSAGGGAIYLSSASNASVSNCVFAGNTAANGGGVAMQAGQVTGCTFESNNASGNGGGLHVTGNAAVAISQCAIRANTSAADGGGMYVGAGVTPTLTDATFCQNMPDNLQSKSVILGSNIVIAIDGADCEEVFITLGACCLPDGGCVSTTEASCNAAGGTYGGKGTGCGAAKCPEPCPPDSNGDAVINIDDLLALINAWGACP